MSRTILYEANDLRLSTGTGIATYARNLALAAQELGYNVDVLFGVARRLNKSSSELSQILAFDSASERTDFAVQLINALRTPLAALVGLRPASFKQAGIVIGPASDVMQIFGRIHAQTRLADICASYFKAFGRRALAKIDNVPAIFHATHAIPLRVKGCPNIYTIHDVVPLRLPYTTTDDKKYMYKMLKHLAAKADHIVTVSEHSKRDIIECLGLSEDRITNTYQSVSFPQHLLERREDEVADDLTHHFELEYGNYYLFYGALEPKKNIGRIVDAYSLSGTKRKLIVAGSAGWQNHADLAKLHDNRFSELQIRGNSIRRHRRVRRLGYLPLDQLITLIRGARAVIFPSIYEGFGLPVAESMLLGVPVITSNCSSLPEVAGNAAILIDPYDTNALKNAIKALDADDALCRSLVERGRVQVASFSPKRYQQRLEALYRRF